MNCPYCRHENAEERPTCEGCGSGLPRPVCRECGVLVNWDQGMCWRCESLGSDTDRVEIGTGWQVHGINTSVVGRTREIHILNELLKTCVEEHAAQACTVSGGLGMGKSRLLDEFHGQLDKHFDSVTVARGSCRRPDSPPYELFGTVLRNRFYIGLGESGESARQKLLDGVAELTQSALATEDAHLIGHLIGLPFPDSPHVAALQDSPARLEQRAFQALARLLDRDARRAPLVLALEDVHIARPEAVNLINYLVRELSGAPMLVVCTATPDASHELAVLDGESAPHTRIDLHELSDDESERLLRDILRQVDDLPDELVKVAVDRALGSPFTLEQIVRIFLETGVVQTGPSAWKVNLDRLDPERIPGGRDDVVRARLATLTDPERALLQKAALVGDVFWLGALTMLVRLEADHWPEEDRNWNSERRSEDLGRSMRSLRRKDIIRRSPSSRIEEDVEYHFKHRLERREIYATIAPERRINLHRMVAQWLEVATAGNQSAAHVQEIARHYDLGGNSTKAAYFHIHAGDLARDRYLNRQAVEHYIRGLAALSEENAVTKIETLHNLGGVYTLIGEPDEALCYLREMLRYAWILANKAKGGVAFMKMGKVYRSLGEHEFAMRHFERARALFEDVEDQRGIAACLDDIGRLHWLLGDLDTALTHHEEALALRRTVGDARSVALSLSRIGAIHLIRGEFKTALTMLRESLDLRKRAGDLRGVAESLNALGAIFHEREEYDQAEALWVEALGDAERVGDRTLQAKILNNTGECCLEVGRLEDGAGFLDRALQISEEIRARGVRVDILRNLGRLAMLQGELTTAVERCERAVALAEETGVRLHEGIAWATLGEVHSRTLYDASRGRDGGASEADRCLERAIEILGEVGNDAVLGRALRLHGNVLVERGETEAGRAHLDRATEIFRKLEMGSVLEKTERMIAEI